MDTSFVCRLRLASLISTAILFFVFIAFPVRSCHNYKATAKAYQDSTAYYKIEAAKVCQQKIDSLTTWHLRAKAQDEAKFKTLKDNAPDWLR